MKLVACNSNIALAESIAKKLKKPLCKSIIKRFIDIILSVSVLAILFPINVLIGLIILIKLYNQ